MIQGLIEYLKYRTPLGWRQLRHNRTRMIVAIAGVVFADVLVFMQLGVMGALYESAVTPIRLLNTDIFLTSPEARDIGKLGTIPRSRLYQALGVTGVASGSVLQVGTISVRGIQSNDQASVTAFGFDPEFDAFTPAEIAKNRSVLRQADTVLLDRLSRSALTPIIEKVARGESPRIELNGRTVTIEGLYALGASFQADGSLIMSDQTYLRLFPKSSGSAVSAIMLKVSRGTDINQIVRDLRRIMPSSDTKIMSKQDYIDFVKNYMAKNTPIGFVFTFGVIIGLVIGFAIVYQILSADVNDHLAEYATFKAMGFRHSYLLGVVFEEAILLAALGFLPGILLSLLLYFVIGVGTELAVNMPFDRPFLVLFLTFCMCCVSGALATQRLRSADPAEVF